MIVLSIEIMRSFLIFFLFVYCRARDGDLQGPAYNRRLSCPEHAHSSVHKLPPSQLSASEADIAICVDLCGPQSAGSSCGDLSDRSDISPASRRKRIPHRRLLRLRDEIERLCSRAGSQLKDGLTTVRARLSPSRDMEREDGRVIRIEFDNGKTHRKSKSRDNVAEEEDWYDTPNHNYSTFLDIHPLTNGVFSADLRLDTFPAEEDLIIRIRNSKLDLFLQRRPQGKAVSRPYRCGVIDLPIYVDPLSLEITALETFLTIEARTKGFLSRRMSLSSDDLRAKHTSPRQPRSPVVKRKQTYNATKWYVDTTGHNHKIKAFRTRSNTR